MCVRTAMCDDGLRGPWLEMRMCQCIVRTDKRQGKKQSPHTNKESNKSNPHKSVPLTATLSLTNNDLKTEPEIVTRREFAQYCEASSNVSHRPITDVLHFLHTIQLVTRLQLVEHNQLTSLPNFMNVMESDAVFLMGSDLPQGRATGGGGAANQIEPTSKPPEQILQFKNSTILK